MLLAGDADKRRASRRYFVEVHFFCLRYAERRMRDER